jgi:hypothetical protein
MSSGYSARNNRRRQNLNALQAGKCFYCPSSVGVKITDIGNPVLEHYIPRSHGGTRLVLACGPCDKMKGMISGPDFEEIIKKVVAQFGGEFTMAARIRISGICKARNHELQAAHYKRAAGEEKTTKRRERIKELAKVVVTDYPIIKQYLRWPRPG